MRFLVPVLAIIGFSSGVGAQPDPRFTNCVGQSRCIGFDVTEQDDCVCHGGPCQFKVCLELQLDNENCGKSATDTISHICAKNDTVCQNGSKDFALAAEIDDSTLGNGHRQCQTVGPGEQVQFLLKDGSGCNSDPLENFIFGDLNANCQGRPMDISSCTGNGIGQECVWTFTAPTTCANPSNRSDDSSLSPAIDLRKTVHLGSSRRRECNPGSEIVWGTVGREIHYCYEVINTGDTHLKDVSLSDDCLSFTDSCSTLAPGASCRVAYNTNITSAQTCDGRVTGNPSEEDGTELTDLEDVADNDSAGVGVSEYDRECFTEREELTMPDGKIKLRETKTCRTCNCE